LCMYIRIKLPIGVIYLSGYLVNYFCFISGAAIYQDIHKIMIMPYGSQLLYWNIFCHRLPGYYVPSVILLGVTRCEYSFS
jgi:hypothetical protein